jgi:hypothetical protein
MGRKFAPSSLLNKHHKSRLAPPFYQLRCEILIFAGAISHLLLYNPLSSRRSRRLSSTPFVCRDCCAARFCVCGAADKRYSLSLNMQHAVVYSFTDRFLVMPSCTTPTGLRLASEPYVALPLAVTDLAFTHALKSALDISTREVPHPVNWKAVALPRLTAAGVKTERAFQLKSKLVEVVKDSNGIHLRPTHNGGATGDKKGFCWIESARFVISATLNESDFVAQIKKAFSLCTE